FTQIDPGGLELGLIQNASLACLEHQAKPAGQFMPIIVTIDAIEPILALGRADERSPTLEVAQCRPDNLRPSSRVNLCWLIDHNAIIVEPTHPLVIVCPVKTNLCPIGTSDFQLCFTGRRHSHNWRRVVLQIIPGHVLGLAVGWSDVRIARWRIFAVVLQCSPDDVVDRADRLSEPSMRDNLAESLS